MGFMTTLVKADKSMYLFEYRDESNSKYITSPLHLPETQSGLKKYFDGTYRPNSSNQDIWAQVKIGLNN